MRASTSRAATSRSLRSSSSRTRSRTSTSAMAAPTAQYNWELFFHAPLLIASRLTKNQRFDDAQRWFHYIFDPTDASPDDTPRRFWRTRPFYENATPKPIEELLKLLDYDGADPASRALREDLEHQVEEWREHPFDPHLLARLRTGRLPGDGRDEVPRQPDRVGRSAVPPGHDGDHQRGDAAVRPRSEHPRRAAARSSPNEA